MRTLIRSRREGPAQPRVEETADGPRPVPVPAPAPKPEPIRAADPPRTVAGSTWVMACIAVLILIVLIVFVAQNTASVRVTLFSFHGRFPLAVELLAAVAAGCVLTLGLGTTRILQLRRIVRRRRRADLVAAKEARVAEETRIPEPELETPEPTKIPAQEPEVPTQDE
jgi:uncharacterized integral membrane protein